LVPDAFCRGRGIHIRFEGRRYFQEKMNLESFIYKLQKLLRSEVERNVQVIASGSIDSMENYKYVTGKIHALDAISQEISNLLEEKEQNNNVRSITKEV